MLAKCNKRDLVRTLREQMNASAAEATNIMESLAIVEEFFGNYTVIGAGVDKNNTPAAIIACTDSIRLLTGERCSPIFTPRLLFTTLPNGVFRIDDIITPQINAGRGTMLLKSAEIWAAENGMHEMIGFLSFVDIGHRTRQEHFYLKNGFCISDASLKKMISQDN